MPPWGFLQPLPVASHHNNNHAPSMLYPTARLESDNNHPYPASLVSLDSSLNLSTDTSSSLFFMKIAAGLGLNDSLDLRKKMQHYHDPSLTMAAGPNHTSPLGLPTPQDDTTGTSGDPEDNLPPEEEANEEDEDEAEEDLNTYSYEDLMLELDDDKDNGESFDASVNHTDTQLEKQEADP